MKPWMQNLLLLAATAVIFYAGLRFIVWVIMAIFLR